MVEIVNFVGIVVIVFLVAFGSAMPDYGDGKIKRWWWK